MCCLWGPRGAAQVLLHLIPPWLFWNFGWGKGKSFTMGDHSSSDSESRSPDRKKRRVARRDASRVATPDGKVGTLGSVDLTTGDHPFRALDPRPGPRSAAGPAAFSLSAFISTFEPDAEKAQIMSMQEFLFSAEISCTTTAALAKNRYEDFSSACSAMHLRAKGILRETCTRAQLLHAPAAAQTSGSVPFGADGSGVQADGHVSAIPDRLANEQDEEMVRLVGGKTANAMTVARLLRGQHTIDVQVVLRKAKLDRLGFLNTPGDALFKALYNIHQEWLVERQGSQDSCDICFPYADLTRGDVIAPWTNVEAIGGASNYAGEGGMDALGNTQDVERLAKRSPL